ncbi:uncharacterized protein LOC133338237 [Musca vetustissima]|uniref:uncharacterized protein LOC133338237 n=1 Tax=Musca vetustissima TaxID=27455 RepID=UPI002AB5EA56|nr:uncharacterized protein LOC133338237 [Musca vetustissima]
MKFTLVLLLAIGLAMALAEPEPKQQLPRGVIHQIKAGVAGPNPYIFLTVPHGRSQVIQGFEVVEGDDDDDEVEKISKIENHDEEEMEDEDEEDNVDDDEMEDNMPQHDDDDDEEDDDMILDVMKNIDTKTQMMVSRENAGAIMVPDEIIEIEGQSVIDEKTGKPAILLPRSILDSIPDGSVVALMERPIEGRSAGEERANRVIVRRRRRGSRRNVKRGRRGNRRRVVNRRRGGNRRRRNGNRVRVVRVNGNRRRVIRGNRRRRVIRV